MSIPLTHGYDALHKAMQKRTGGHRDHRGQLYRNTHRAKVANNTYVVRNPYYDAYNLRLHSTDIVTWHATGRIDVTLGGWDSSLTWSRLRYVFGYKIGKCWRRDCEGMIQFGCGSKLVFQSLLTYAVDVQARLWGDTPNPSPGAAQQAAWNLGKKQGIKQGLKDVRERNEERIIQQAAYRVGKAKLAEDAESVDRVVQKGADAAFAQGYLRCIEDLGLPGEHERCGMNLDQLARVAGDNYSYEQRREAARKAVSGTISEYQRRQLGR